MTRAERRRHAKIVAKIKRADEVREAALVRQHINDKRAAERMKDRVRRKPVKPLLPGQPDDRDEKYLHSYARGMRGLKQALAA